MQNKFYLLCYTILFLVLGLLQTEEAKSADKNLEPNACNPAPLADDLVLPGPNGTSFVFRAVTVKSGANPFSGALFTAGDAEGGFRTLPTRMMVSGPFPTKGTDDNIVGWQWWLGKYEITRLQYDAVMKTKKVTKPEDENLPISNISWLEALEFINNLNLWLYENALDKLPMSGPAPAFVRLPSESEWEYAARGGEAVEVAIRDAPFPYEDDDLTAYEWFSGPSSSHNRIQPIGQLKANPLGLHDMLGNVSEMTDSRYQVEYVQGRSGGMVARGGHFRTPENKIHVAMRTEEPPFLGPDAGKMRPNTKETLGLRILLGAPLLVDRKAISELDSSAEEWRTNIGKESPAVLSSAPVSEQVAVGAKDALAALENIKKTAGTSPEGKRYIASIEASLRSMDKVQREANRTSAKIWVQIASERAVSIEQNLITLNVITKNLVEGIYSEANLPNMRIQQWSREENIRDGLNRYGEIMEELSKIPQDLVKEALKEHSNDLTTRLKNVEKSFATLKKDAQEERKKMTINAEALKQRYSCIAVVQKHYERYLKEKKMNAPVWRNDYTNMQTQAK